VLHKDYQFVMAMALSGIYAEMWNMRLFRRDKSPDRGPVLVFRGSWIATGILTLECRGAVFI
jgi:hypothetical protein